MESFHDNKFVLIYWFLSTLQKILNSENHVTSVIGINVSETSYADATKQIQDWAKSGESRHICIVNVHVVMEAYDSPKFREVVNCADLVTPDGVPLVWMMRAKGQREQSRVYGPTLMLHVLESAARENISVGFYGSRPEVLNALEKQMQARFESLNVAFSYSPPFRELSPEEDTASVEQINRSGVKVLFIGLGCPKQEIWMAEHQSKVKAVMLGVGAAFDFHAGLKPQAPAWMQKIGLEWFFRFFTEPRRLWRRYLYHNPRFVFLAVADLLGLLKEGD
jgi:N-acetylglucosaminyldiphosphoundecaprenol N-acetyl-beta-D-mannosaminyltransferase